MAINKQVRDGFLGDLSEDLQLKVMNIHKLLVSTCDEVWKDSAYDPIRNAEWAKTAIDEFCTQPANNSEIGSVRVYKQGKKNSCMIQLSGHFTNHRNDIDHELLHDFIRHVHQDMRQKVRKQFDMRLTCESEHGEPFEGLDVWTSSKVAKSIWDSFEDKKTKKIKPMKESTNTSERNHYTEMMFAEMYELPNGLQELVESLTFDIVDMLEESSAQLAQDMLAGAGHVRLLRKDNQYKGIIELSEDKCDDISNNDIRHILKECAIKDDSTKKLIFTGNGTFGILLESQYVEKLWNYLESSDASKNEKKNDEEDLSDLFKDEGWSASTKTISEDEVPPHILKRYKKMKMFNKVKGIVKKESMDTIFDPFTESNNEKPEYNTDMSEAEAKRTLRTVSQNMINDIANKKDYKVSQYTANIYANIITKNLLPIWAKGFRKFTITLDGYQSFNTFEFKAPKMTQDFVSRFINGRETINGLIHRSPEINVKMSPRIFHTMKNPDDAFNFFRAAIKYYNDGVEKYSDKLMYETMKLNKELKHLVSTTKLSGIVTCPMQLIFVFDDVDMSSKDTFKISQQDIKTVNQFIKNIYTRYAAPDKEKKQIVDDVQEMVKALREACDTSGENMRELTYLPEAVDEYLFGKYEKEINEFTERWIMMQEDVDWIRYQKNPEVKYLQEKFGVKKLKKIPSDLVAYITIETESIRDANDKMMISSYCLSKIEIVEWYIELLEVGSKKYIVPHTKPYLESLRTQLLACFKKIMDVKIINPNSRPLIDIQYPKGYEG